MRADSARELPFTLQHAGWLHVLPVFHYRAEFASVVRHTLRVLRPRAVAVELPASLRDVVLRGIERLPQLSVVTVPDAHGELLYLPIEPIDAGIEALRTAREMDLRVALVDLDEAVYAEYRDPAPDAYALHRIGLESFYRAYREGAASPQDPADAHREAAMAFGVQRLHREEGGPVLLVCGMKHAEGVLAQIERSLPIPFGRPRRPEASLLHLHPDCLPEVLADAPAIEAVYELLRTGPPAAEVAPTLDRIGRQVGPFRILDGSGAGPGHDLAASLREIARRSGAPLDRLRAQIALFELAVQHWESRTGESLRRWQRETFARFSRNLALSGGRLVCDAYELLTAVRGVGDENLLHAAHELLTAYPWQEKTAEIPSVTIGAEQLQLETRRLRIRPRFHRPKRRPLPSGRPRRSEAYPGEWLEGFDEDGFCSYPPEDLRIEDYGQFLRRKGTALISEENARVEPFGASMLDGIDVRETLRRRVEDGRIYVRELRPAPGGVSSVVVILDEDCAEEGPERYSFQLTWLGEHDQESDMAFYSTRPEHGIVGPGICRCEYGGFLMSYPPRRLLDVWTDPDYRLAESKAERLLLAALDYSQDRVVVHVAARPPRSVFKTLAGRLGRRILHIPLGQLSPQSLARIRVFHILAGRSKRETAKDYVR